MAYCPVLSPDCHYCRVPIKPDRQVGQRRSGRCCRRRPPGRGLGDLTADAGATHAPPCAAPRCAAGRPPLALRPHPRPRPRAEKKFEGTRAHRIQRAFLKCLLCAERGAARRGGAGRPPFGQLSSARCHRRGTGSRASRRRRAGLHAFGGAVGGAGRLARGLSADGALERQAVLTCLRQ